MDKGQALVELGVSFVILMLLISGAAEFGVALFQFVQLRDAVQEGALYGSQCQCDTEEIEERVRWSSNGPINLQDDSVSLDVLVTRPDGSFSLPPDMCEQDAITVRAIYAHKIFMPFIPQILGSQNILLRASVTDTVLIPVCG